MFRWTDEADTYLTLTRDKSAKEIALILGISEGAVYHRRSKIGVKFHRTLKDKPTPNGKTKKWPPSLKMVKDFIFSRDNNQCHYCGEPASQIDHKVPQSHGGSNLTTNLVASCAKCNNLKGNACYECPRWRELINV